MRKLLFIFLSLLLLDVAKSSAAYAQEQYFNTSGLPIPRLISLRASEVNMRTGPGTQYPIRWVYRRTGLPVEIVQEFDTWRKIRDRAGAEGWVHQSMLWGRRYGIVAGESNTTLIKKPSEKAGRVAMLEPGVQLRLYECRAMYCRVGIGDLKGWVLKKNLWGVYADEEFN